MDIVATCRKAVRETKACLKPNLAKDGKDYK